MVHKQWLRRIFLFCVFVLAFQVIPCLFGQVSAPDGRYRADILLIVAHPDDDTLVASYLARAIFDQHKRVAVIYCTRGDSGANAFGSEHAGALALIREVEGRRAMSALGITNVWFLEGRDTASQNVLASLGNWPHGQVLEQAVRIMRVTRPEVVFTWLPSSVAGENHGDHQAAGVIATEAFDLAGDPAAFPSQLAAPARLFENALEGLHPWQPKKLYYFSDAFDTGFLAGRGPQFSGKEISPSRKLSYLELATQSAAPYYTQSPDPHLNQQIERGENLRAITKALTEGENAFFGDPVRLLLAKSLVKTSATADVFDGIGPAAMPFSPVKPEPPAIPNGVIARLGGTWGFYHNFWRAHDLSSLNFRRPEIAVNPADTLAVPLWLSNNSAIPKQILVALALPPGWRLRDSLVPYTLAAYSQAEVAVPVIAPGQENKQFQEIRVTAQADGHRVCEESLFVEVRSNVAAQLK